MRSQPWLLVCLGACFACLIQGTEIKVGVVALLTYNPLLNLSTSVALDLVAERVNSDPNLLPNHTLKVIPREVNCFAPNAGELAIRASADLAYNEGISALTGLNCVTNCESVAFSRALDIPALSNQCIADDKTVRIEPSAELRVDAIARFIAHLWPKGRVIIFAFESVDNRRLVFQASQSCQEHGLIVEQQHVIDSSNDELLTEAIVNVKGGRSRLGLIIGSYIETLALLKRVHSSGLNVEGWQWFGRVNPNMLNDPDNGPPIEGVIDLGQSIQNFHPTWIEKLRERACNGGSASLCTQVTNADPNKVVQFRVGAWMYDQVYAAARALNATGLHASAAEIVAHVHGDSFQGMSGVVNFNTKHWRYSDYAISVIRGGHYEHVGSVLLSSTPVQVDILPSLKFQNDRRPLAELPLCPAGSYFVERRDTGYGTCLLCAENTFQVEASVRTECDPCPDGHISEIGSVYCDKIPPAWLDDPRNRTMVFVVAIVFVLVFAFGLWLLYRRSMNQRILISKLRMEQKLELAEKERHDAEQANLSKQKFIRYIMHEIRIPFQVLVSGIDLMKGQTEKFGRMLSVATSLFETSQQPTPSLGSARLSGHVSTRDATAVAAARAELKSLVDKWEDPIAEAMDSLQMMMSASDTMIGVINDVLDLQKIEEGKMVLKLTPITVSATLESVATIMRGYAATNGITLCLEVQHELKNKVIQSDQGRMQQSLCNFLSNAFKFSKEGGKVWLRATRVPAGQRVTGLLPSHANPTDCATVDSVAIDVMDTGCGIAETETALLFKEFSQVGKGPLSHGGSAGGPSPNDKGTSGLGLSIARALVELQNGQVGLTSVLGQGSTFRVLMPMVGDHVPDAPKVGVSTNTKNHDSDDCAPALMEPHDEGEGQPSVLSKNTTVDITADLRSGSSAAGTTAFPSVAHTPTTTHSKEPPSMPLLGARFLLVEDVPVVQKICKRLLVNAGAIVDVASNGEQGLSLVEQNLGAYDCVLLDKEMPVMNGLEMVQCVRKLPGCRRGEFLIIGLTGNALASDCQEFIDHGADTVLTKPMKIQLLISTLESSSVFTTRQNAISTTSASAAESASVALTATTAAPANGNNDAGSSVVSTAQMLTPCGKDFLHDVCESRSIEPPMPAMDAGGSGGGDEARSLHFIDPIFIDNYPRPLSFDAAVYHPVVVNVYPTDE